MALAGGFDIILLDVMMPGLDGFDVLKQLRRRSTSPVILLTARSSKDDRINGLESGADDYLSKPFDPEELLARIRAVLRRLDRAKSAAPTTLRLHNVQLTLGTREVTRDDVRLNITSTEFDILEHLMRSAGRVVTRTELMTVLHQCEAMPYDRSLDVHISHLRKKLGPRGELIRTVRGAGYLFCSDAEGG
jgi:two-component system response regulator CpxR